MKIIPAIDIKGGKVVRLRQGKAENETVYNNSPMEVARMWAGYGVSLLHVVDLDGAMEGKFKNLPLIKEMARTVKTGIEVGGGLRSEDTIKDILDAGIEKVVIGTKALDEKFVSKVVKRFGDRIVAGIDAKDGLVYTKGWLARAKERATDLARRIADIGVKTINYTDIAKDGMLKGPNIKSIKEMLGAAKIDVVVGGGISTLEDIKRLKVLEPEGLKGMIIGKALYEHTIDLKEAIGICTNI